MKKQKNILSVLSPYAYITPISLILLTFVAGSLIIAVCFSFTKYNIITPAKFNGLFNYQKLLRDSKLRQFAKASLFIPVLSSNAVVGTIWKAILNGGHPAVSFLFGLVGLDPTMLLGDSTSAIITLSMIIVWKSMGYYMIITLSSLMSIPDNYYEAARVDGANSWNIFSRITIPLLKPTLILNTFLVIISSMQVFDIVYTMTGGGPSMSTTTMVMYAYQLTFKGGKAGYAMTVSNVLMLMVLVVVLFQQRFMKREASEI